MPFYSTEQTKAAVVRHASETAARLIKRSHEYSLGECLSTPYMHGTGDEGWNRAYAIGFVYQRGAFPRAIFGRDDVVTKTRSNEVWVELKQSNLLTILGQLDQGRGRLVLRVWYHWPRLEKQELRQHGSYYVGDNLGEHYRLCDEGSSGGGSGAWSGARSDAASGAGSGSGEVHVVDSRACQLCHGGGTLRNDSVELLHTRLKRQGSSNGKFSGLRS